MATVTLEVFYGCYSIMADVVNGTGQIRVAAPIGESFRDHAAAGISEMVCRSRGGVPALSCGIPAGMELTVSNRSKK